MGQEDEINAMKSRGVELAQAGRLEEARGLFDQVVERDGGDAQAWHTLSIINGMLGHLDAAGDCCRRVIELQPEYADARLNLGNVLLLQGKPQEAVAQYNDVLGRHPDYAPALINQGRALLNLGRYEEASTCFRRLIDLGADLLNSHNNLGYAQLMLRHYDEALAHYHEALRVNPNDAETHFNLGNAHMEIGNIDKALAAYENAISINPNHAGAHINIGNLLLSHGKYDQAIESLRRAIEITPASAEAHNNLGNALKATGDMEQATASYRRAIELKSDYAEAYFNLGSACSAQGDVHSAIGNYRRAIALKPRYAAAYHNLGYALGEQGHLEDAVVNYQKAIEINPKYALAYNNLANAQHKQGDTAQAIMNYRQAVAADPRYNDAYENLARALKAKGNMAEAVAVYRQWLENVPGNAIAQHLLAAATGEAVPERCSDDYVIKTFDDFSHAFDKRLAEIGYCGPELVTRAVEETYRTPRADMAILDAGCGTGLCGPGARPFANRLVGVDLSPGMLAKAAERGLYDELVKAELTAYLMNTPNTYDVVVSADTLIYFGALDALLAGIANTLRDGGTFAFTVEWAKDEEAPEGFLLNPHGRYSHTDTYIQQMLNKVGMSMELVREATIRKELGKPVAGLAVVGRKGASAGD